MASALLDECIDWRLSRWISRHAVRAIKDMQWTGLRDGTLLERAEAEFDALITVDRKIPTQQNVEARSLMVTRASGGIEPAEGPHPARWPD